MDKYRFVTKIKFYREQRGITQQELADEMGVRRETIVNLEKGKYNPSLVLGMQIAKYFGVRVEDIFELADEQDLKQL